MEHDYFKEKIGLLKTEMNLLWSGAFIICGGSIALFINLTAKWQMLLITVGVLLTTVFINAFVMKRDEAIKLIKYLKGGK